MRRMDKSTSLNELKGYKGSICTEGAKVLKCTCIILSLM